VCLSREYMIGKTGQNLSKNIVFLKVWFSHKYVKLMFSLNEFSPDYIHIYTHTDCTSDLKSWQ